MVGFKRDLKRLDLSKLLGDKIVEPLGSVGVVLRDLRDEHIMLCEALLVGTVERRVEG